MLLAQLSDLHLRGGHAPGLTDDSLERCVAAAFDRMQALSPRADAVLITGDLARFEREPAAFQLHRWGQDHIVTHTGYVDRYPRMASLGGRPAC